MSRLDYWRLSDFETFEEIDEEITGICGDISELNQHILGLRAKWAELQESAERAK